MVIHRFKYKSLPKLYRKWNELKSSFAQKFLAFVDRNARFEFRAKNIKFTIICYYFTWDRLMASWLMNHEAIELMPKLL